MLPDLNPILAAVAALLLSFGGWAALARAMARHHAQFTAHPRTSSGTLAARIAGVTLLTGALLAFIAGWGPSIGFVGWACAIAVSALAMIFLMPAWPRGTRIAAYGVPMAGLFVCVLAAFV